MLKISGAGVKIHSLIYVSVTETIYLGGMVFKFVNVRRSVVKWLLLAPSDGITRSRVSCLATICHPAADGGSLKTKVPLV